MTQSIRQDHADLLQQLKDRQRRKGYTNRELGEWTGKSAAAISLNLSGQRSMSLADFVRVANGLGLSVGLIERFHSRTNLEAEA